MANKAELKSTRFVIILLVLIINAVSMYGGYTSSGRYYDVTESQLVDESLFVKIDSVLNKVKKNSGLNPKYVFVDFYNFNANMVPELENKDINFDEPTYILVLPAVGFWGTVHNRYTMVYKYKNRHYFFPDIAAGQFVVPASKKKRYIIDKIDKEDKENMKLFFWGFRPDIFELLLYDHGNYTVFPKNSPEYQLVTE
ncbi:MAG: hypothetical protein K2M94_08110 [Paramuribaculum sp.]|nr:hypothetical protein [Paramuribaculum sp.]